MKKMGFTLLELVIVVAIIMVLGGATLMGLRMRAHKDELLKLKVQIPAVLETATLYAYEFGYSGSIQASSKRIDLNIGSRNFEIETNALTISTRPSSLATTISALGTFSDNFDIILSYRGTELYEFQINTKANLGVYNVTEIEK